MSHTDTAPAATASKVNAMIDASRMSPGDEVTVIVDGLIIEITRYVDTEGWSVQRTDTRGINIFGAVSGVYPNTFTGDWYVFTGAAYELASDTENLRSGLSLAIEYALTH